ncbi:MAG: hypothetical protein KAH84_06485 [Thiomargarita sp.]|nr:hypothetical protein [Thiomargarita sp.]
MRILTLYIVIAILLTACDEHESDEKLPIENETTVEHSEQHLTNKYVCPMHPEIVSEKPGSCSICGMFLVEKAHKSHENPATINEHSEQHLADKYVCPMHPEIMSEKPGSCSICGMFLVEKEQNSTTSENSK